MGKNQEDASSRVHLRQGKKYKTQEVMISNSI